MATRTPLAAAPRDTPSRVLPTIVLALALALALAVGFSLVQRSPGDTARQAAGRGGDGFDPPVAVPPNGEYVRSRVLASGDLEVDHWIRSHRPIFQLTLSIPGALRHGPTRPVARQVRVQSDVATSDGTAEISRKPRTYLFSGASRLHVSYILSGAVARTGSAPDRALVQAASLDLVRRPAGGPRTLVVTGARVLAAACSSDEVATEPRPCGNADGKAWRVSLSSRDRDDRVLAQLDLA